MSVLKSLTLGRCSISSSATGSLSSSKCGDEVLGGFLRLRNYYYRPRMNGGEDTYRAIHFELLDIRRRAVEVQIVSELREVISLVYHAFVFKRRFHFLSLEHEEWLQSSSLVANVLDAQTLS